MIIVLMSDSHGRHGNIYIFKPGDALSKQDTLNHITGGVYLPAEADMIVHAGDVSMMGREYEVEEFLKWYSALPYKYKVMIAGNHDFLFDRQRTLAKDLLKKYPNIIYIENEMVEIEGVKIWGSPIQPWFHSWAFNKYRGEDIKKYWDLIPDDVDILVTHGPPYNVLDMCNNGDVVGCEDLMEKVQKVKPKIHVFGHIHEAAGYEFKDGIHFVNASVLNLRYQLMNKPLLFEIDKNKNVKLYNPMETQTQTKPKFKYFWGGTFSQWAPSIFIIEDKRFTHAEQYMMYKKAMLFSDTETAEKVMQEEHPREQKALGRKVKNFDKVEWENQCKKFVYDANYAKFTQNAEMLKELMATGDMELVEASPEDAIWGIGLAEDDLRSRNKETWLGTNWLGEILTQLRQDLKKNPPIKEQVSADAFYKIDIRICEIISVEKIEKKDKLYKLGINTGTEKRTIVSGIAQQFTPEQLLNKKFPFVLNLPPIRLGGVLSNGMIMLAAADGKYFSFGDENIEVGAVVV